MREAEVGTDFPYGTSPRRGVSDTVSITAPWRWSRRPDDPVDLRVCWKRPEQNNVLLTLTRSRRHIFRECVCTGTRTRASEACARRSKWANRMRFRFQRVKTHGLGGRPRLFCTRVWCASCVAFAKTDYSNDTAYPRIKRTGRVTGLFHKRDDLCVS